MKLRGSRCVALPPEHRIANNQSVFRRVNESIERGRWPGEEDAPAVFCCECAQFGCGELIELSVREYERVRANGRRFIVALGHNLPEVEDVVEEHKTDSSISSPHPNCAHSQQKT